MKHFPAVFLLFLALVRFAVAQGAAPAPAPATPRRSVDASAAIVKRDNGEFMRRHEAYLARGKAGPVGLLFLGDSITEGWESVPHIWQAYYGKFQPANFGISGDRTQHVMWRIENGELAGIHPRVVVLMIGTNNTSSHSAQEISAANKKIVDTILAKIPETKVLLLAIFPRGPVKNDQGVVTEDYTKKMEVIRAVNASLAKLENGQNIRYLDIGGQFLGQDGKIPNAIMSDQLHPDAAGYQIWADAMKPLLDEMLK